MKAITPPRKILWASLVSAVLLASPLALAKTRSFSEVLELVTANEQQNETTMLVMTRASANRGDAGAQYSLGKMYEEGRDVKQDYYQAAQWYQKAANQGNADAQYSLGKMYFLGQGVAENYHQAVQWYQKAVNQGHTEAQYKLGYMYESGYGVARDYRQAFSWYQKVANQGVAEAQANKNKSFKELVTSTSFSWDAPYSAAQYKLGLMYRDGQGIAQDFQQARFWLQEADARGFRSAKQALQKLNQMGK